MSALKILNVIGCRPSFIQIASLVAEMKNHPEIDPLLVAHGGIPEKWDGLASQ